VDDVIIDDIATSHNAPVIQTETTFKTVLYLVMVVNGQTLLYVQKNALTSTIVLDMPSAEHTQSIQIMDEFVGI